MFKLLELYVKPVSKTLKAPMPRPTIFHPILPSLGILTPYLGEKISFRLIQQSCPRSACTEGDFKLCPPAIRNPKPAIYYKLLIREPRGVQSFRRALHLGNDFLRDRARSLLIARKMHRVFRAPLRR